MRSHLLVSALLLSALAACGGGTSEGAEPKSSAPKAECLKVPTDLAKAMASGVTKTKVTRATAVKSPDFKNLYFVAVQFTAEGIDKQTGVWASNALQAGDGVILAVDGIAQQFSDWPHGNETDADISPADSSVATATDCL